jgi:hypothetical protein
MPVSTRSRTKKARDEAESSQQVADGEAHAQPELVEPPKTRRGKRLVEESAVDTESGVSVPSGSTLRRRPAMRKRKHQETEDEQVRTKRVTRSSIVSPTSAPTQVVSSRPSRSESSMSSVVVDSGKDALQCFKRSS